LQRKRAGHQRRAVNERTVIVMRRSSASAGLATGFNADAHAEAATNDHPRQ
jgi:hypothetical protein